MDGVMVLKRLTESQSILDSTLLRNKEYVWDPWEGRCSLFELTTETVNFCTVPMFFMSPNGS